MFKKFNVVVADNKRYLILKERGNVDFAVGLDNDTWTSRFDKELFSNYAERHASPEELKTVLEKACEILEEEGFIY
jgi:hypothetical protein